MGDVIELVLEGQIIPLVNHWTRTHFRARGRFMRDMAWQFAAQIQQQGIPVRGPDYPLDHCCIHIIRSHPLGPMPDVDAILPKPVLDVLQPASKRHPYGLGVIKDDTREVIKDLICEATRAPKRTVVRIRRWDPPEPECEEDEVPWED